MCMLDVGEDYVLVFAGWGCLAGGFPNDRTKAQYFCFRIHSFILDILSMS